MFHGSFSTFYFGRYEFLFGSRPRSKLRAGRATKSNPSPDFPARSLKRRPQATVSEMEQVKRRRVATRITRLAHRTATGPNQVPRPKTGDSNLTCVPDPTYRRRHENQDVEAPRINDDIRSCLFAGIFKATGDR